METEENRDISWRLTWTWPRTRNRWRCGQIFPERHRFSWARLGVAVCANRQTDVESKQQALLLISINGSSKKEATSFVACFLNSCCLFEATKPGCYF